MINAHTTSLSMGGSLAVLPLLIAILVGWHIVFQFYNKAGKIEGF